eukprot:CAMPEP_0117541404 /NCGR_PEP_ID=MMETSP0784-20121206/44002_1 /TAXON_ID=39447 /ORGANISM="" /LENGTH=103 /DNA_ID=CAMNT_0005338099 /DNA_START=93 /DNA_END=401 /DNA_ORIENTATION=-
MQGYSRASLFRDLPADHLMPHETALRKALMDILHLRPEPFPLLEWIDRRIGGEVETIPVGKGGGFDIRLRARGPPMPAMQAAAHKPEARAFARGPPPLTKDEG